MRPRSLVEVKSAEEIALTLDASGTLDGLPFMPEMVEFCGRRFRILRRAEKTCIEAPTGAFLIREFRGGEVFLLEGLRCSGANHDGCQRLCMFFWKAAWLRLVPDRHPDAGNQLHSIQEIRPTLRTKIDAERYFCQSTELGNATRIEPIGAFRILWKCLRDFWSGGIGLFEAIALIFAPLYRKVRDRVVGRPRLLGNLKRTPVGALNLQPGELVAIKSLSEIRETLDTQGRNRGLVADIELGRFCGSRYRVRSRLDRMISESNGRMRHPEGTVLLEGNTCLCARALGGCPRLEFCYWREVWLERVSEDDASER
jgi:hypothetical protein